jgi:hypothetical protein
MVKLAVLFLAAALLFGQNDRPSISVHFVKADLLRGLGVPAPPLTRDHVQIRVNTSRTGISAVQVCASFSSGVRCDVVFLDSHGAAIVTMDAERLPGRVVVWELAPVSETRSELEG